MRKIRRVRQEGDDRVKSWFAVFPVSIEIDGIVETRWLEYVRVLQTYDCFYTGDDIPSYYWENIRFLKEGELESSS